MLRLPNVYTILPGVPFAKALATQLWDEYKHDLRALSDVQIYLPNRRSIRAVANTFLEISDGQATLLPQLTPLGDIDEEDLLESDPFSLDEDPFLTPAIPSLERQILLTKLIQARDDLQVSPTQAFRLAGELGRFLDRAHTEQVDLAKLDTLVLGDLATHWQITRDFLAIIIQFWPQILAERNEIDPAQRRNLVLEKKVIALRTNPPTHRVIAAGSTGSIPASAALLDMIARLPNGSVILPGFDPTLDERLWTAIDETHPYFYQKNLITRMGIDRQSIKLWPDSGNPSAETLAMMHHAMQPQDVFNLSYAVVDTDKLNTVDFIAADNPLHEAKTIALRLRDVLNEPDKTAMVVTPDRLLAQHIQQEMTRWDITVNDSGGQPLSQTTLGTFLKLISGFAASPTQSTHILSLMRHHFFRLHGPETRRHDEASTLELCLRRHFVPHNNLYDFTCNDLPDILTDTLAILRPMHSDTPRSLHEWIETHIAVAEALAQTGDIVGAEILWRQEEGEQASSLLAKLYQAALPHDFQLTANDYSHFIDLALEQVIIRPNYGTHPRLTILSNIEARLQHADYVVLAGLNETVWPAQTKADTWLSRPMQKEIGFGAPERRIGQSALDFLTLYCMKNVCVTWSQKRDDAIAHPSRWLQQIFAVLQKNGHTPLINAQPYAHWASIWDKPRTLHPQPAPSFSPPISARPRKLPVTSIGKWKKDPYAVYAQRVLYLRPLEELDRHPDARDWGNAAHTILEHFIRERKFDSADPRGEYDRLCIDTLTTYPLNTSLKKAWEGKLAVLGDWLVNEDMAHHPHVAVEEGKTKTFTLPDETRIDIYGRADRLDRQGDTVLITDYKTGTLPSEASIERGFEPQLPLLAVLQDEKNVNFRYIKLSGKLDKPVETRTFKDPAALVTRTMEHLDQLLREYYIDGIAYVAQNHRSDHDDYRHLKRVAEWAALPDPDTEDDDTFDTGDAA